MVFHYIDIPQLFLFAREGHLFLAVMSKTGMDLSLYMPIFFLVRCLLLVLWNEVWSQNFR